MRARFDLRGRLRLYDFKAGNSVGGPLVLSVPEVVVAVDPEEFAEQRIRVQRIRLVRPRLRLTRDPDWRWNLEGWEFPDQPTGTPEVIVESGTVSVTIVNDLGNRSPTFTARNVDLRLTPKGKGRYLVQCRLNVDQTKAIEIDGEWNLEQQTWSVLGSVANLQVGQNICTEPTQRLGTRSACAWIVIIQTLDEG